MKDAVVDTSPLLGACYSISTLWKMRCSPNIFPPFQAAWSHHRDLSCFVLLFNLRYLAMHAESPEKARFMLRDVLLLESYTLRLDTGAIFIVYLASF